MVTLLTYTESLFFLQKVLNMYIFKRKEVLRICFPFTRWAWKAVAVELLGKVSFASGTREFLGVGTSLAGVPGAGLRSGCDVNARGRPGGRRFPGPDSKSSRPGPRPYRRPGRLFYH